MDCLTLCLYFSLSVAQSNAYLYSINDPRPYDFDGYQFMVTNRVESLTGTNLGNVTLGMESKYGLFLELDHTSGIDTPEDKGFEQVRIGFRKRWRL